MTLKDQSDTVTSSNFLLCIFLHLCLDILLFFNVLNNIVVNSACLHTVYNNVIQMAMFCENCENVFGTISWMDRK